MSPLAQDLAADDRLIVGIGTSDDAGVYRLSDETALVQTIDVITPIVDDPADFGFIAAVNALSDIYAMGGTPMTALTFLAFEECRLPLEAASLILEGAAKALAGNGCTLLGGHTVQDQEIKFGLAVTGTVHPDRVITNAGAREGDLIYLTKPLGTGIASTALKGEMVPDNLKEEFTACMKRGNGPAAAAMVKTGVRAATDVTGFGLIGHLNEMCSASGLGAAIDLHGVPLMDGVLDMVMIGMVPAGAYSNRSHLQDQIAPHTFPEARLWPLYDPQTSGGLLMAVPPERARALEKALEAAGERVHPIGRFRKEAGIRLE